MKNTFDIDFLFVIGSKRHTSKKKRTKAKLNLSFHRIFHLMYLTKGNCGEMTNAITFNVLNLNQSCSISCCPEGLVTKQKKNTTANKNKTINKQFYGFVYKIRRRENHEETAVGSHYLGVLGVYKDKLNHTRSLRDHQWLLSDSAGFT